MFVLSKVIDVFLAYGKKSVSKDFTDSPNSKEFVLFFCAFWVIEKSPCGMRGNCIVRRLDLPSFMNHSDCLLGVCLLLQGILKIRKHWVSLSLDCMIISTQGLKRFGDKENSVLLYFFSDLLLYLLLQHGDSSSEG